MELLYADSEQRRVYTVADHVSFPAHAGMYFLRSRRNVEDGRLQAESSARMYVGPEIWCVLLVTAVSRDGRRSEVGRGLRR